MVGILYVTAIDEFGQKIKLDWICGNKDEKEMKKMIEEVLKEEVPNWKRYSYKWM